MHHPAEDDLIPRTLSLASEVDKAVLTTVAVPVEVAVSSGVVTDSEEEGAGAAAAEGAPNFFAEGQLRLPMSASSFDLRHRRHRFRCNSEASAEPGSSSLGHSSQQRTLNKDPSSVTTVFPEGALLQQTPCSQVHSSHMQKGSPEHKATRALAGAPNFQEIQTLYNQQGATSSSSRAVVQTTNPAGADEMDDYLQVTI